ncbi:protease complex subunit PrcB family protein [Gracilimonas sp.]|uniref:protease complex subunit PrcB family protein n=1 Tax=Gracilimonas sp. TaxID=1974203 RepID=UPI0028713918|nr:protease complex subunit PrcB family protein [Gracilimonas sp.]
MAEVPNAARTYGRSQVLCTMFSTGKRVTVITLIGMMVAFGCTQLPGDGNNITDSIEVIGSGQYSNFSEEGEIKRVISAKADFAEEWNKVHAGTSPIPDLPNVNFSNTKLALIMLESKPSGGFDITDIEVYESGDKMVIAYSEIVPSEKCVVTMAITRPYIFVSYPDNGQDVEFHKKDDIVKNCSE